MSFDMLEMICATVLNLFLGSAAAAVLRAYLVRPDRAKGRKAARGR